MANQVFTAALHRVERFVCALTGQRLRVILAVLACVMALGSIGRIYTRSFLDNRFDNQRWGLDFYQFWYGGHFFWQGEEPYTSIRSFLKEPDAPTYFVDTRDKSSDPKLHRRWQVNIIPGAAPLFLMMAPLSLLSWVNASIVWSVFNITLGVVLVWLITRLLESKLASAEGILLLGLFFSTIAARQVIEVGQTSLVVTVSMFGALLLGERHPVIAGVLAAIATSKYTLGFPIFIYFLYRCWLTGVISCIATHLLGVLVVAAVGNESPFQVVQAYVDSSFVVLQQTTDYSIHVLAMGWGFAGYMLVGIITIAVVWALVLWFRRASPLVRKDMLSALTLLGIGCMWSLVSLYHGRQDMVVAFLFIAIIVLRISCNQRSGMSTYRLKAIQKHILYTFAIFVFLVWSLPLYGLIGTTTYRWVYTACNIGVLSALVWLSFRIQLPDSQPGTSLPISINAYHNWL